MDAREELRRTIERSRLEELEDLHRARKPSRRMSLLLAWLAGWFRPPRRAAVEPLPVVACGELGITFAGHATLLARYADVTVAFDPMLGMRIGPIPRAVEPGLSPAEMHDVDLVLISHAHPGHLDRRTLRKLPRSATIVVPPRTAHLVSGLGFARVIELGIGQSLQHRRLDVACTPVRHSVGRGGTACSYVIRGDGPSLFFCADSAYFSGFVEIGRRYRPDIAALPIGGYVPRGLRDGHMSPLDAIYAFEDLGARVLVPIHYGAFALSYETLDDPLRWLAQLVAERGLERHVCVLPPGASRRFTRPAEPC